MRNMAQTAGGTGTDGARIAGPWAPWLQRKLRLVALCAAGLCAACSAQVADPQPGCGDPGVICKVAIDPGEQPPAVATLGDAGQPHPLACPAPVTVPPSCTPDPGPCDGLGIACCKGYTCPATPDGCQQWGTDPVSGMSRVACGPSAAGYVGTPWDNGCVQQRSSDCMAAKGSGSAFFCPAQGGPNARDCDVVATIVSDAGVPSGYEWCCITE